jgi:hypothetical protein
MTGIVDRWKQGTEDTEKTIHKRSEKIRRRGARPASRAGRTTQSTVAPELLVS